MKKTKEKSKKTTYINRIFAVTLIVIMLFSSDSYVVLAQSVSGNATDLPQEYSQVEETINSDINAISEEIKSDKQVSENSFSLSSISVNRAGKSIGAKTTLKNPTIENGVTTWDCVYFGNYWQTDTNGNGIANTFDDKELIKWRVLQVNGNDAFLIADQSLDVFTYSNQILESEQDIEKIKWSNCALQSVWISKFSSAAFSSEERKAILKTEIDGVPNGVYLLSKDEVQNSDYGFQSNESCKSTNTAFLENYAEEYNQSYPGGLIKGGWWLRTTSSENLNFADFVSNIGTLGSALKNGYYFGIRPVVHLDISKANVWQYAGTVDSQGNVTENHEYFDIVKSIKSRKPLNILNKGETYYICAESCDEELAAGASFKVTITGDTVVTSTYKCADLASDSTSVLKKFWIPIKLGETGDYKFKVEFCLADGSIITYNGVADSIRVVSTLSTSGECGANARWSFNQSTGKLTISGSGEVVGSPWLAFSKDIRTVVIEDGITKAKDWEVDALRFMQCFNLKSVELGNTFSVVGSLMFRRCISLSDIKFSESVEKIHINAFKESGIESIKLPNSLLVIEERAFEDCKKLNDLTIPQNVQKIGSNAFAGCSSLNNITFKGTEEISSCAFEGCPLEEVTLPASLKSICSEEIDGFSDTLKISPFVSCSNLKNIYVEDGNPYYTSVDGVLYTKSKDMLVLCPPGKEGKYTVLKGTKKIGWSAFRTCEKLTEIVLPENLEYFNFYSISGMKLSNLVIPKGTKQLVLRWGAFWDGGIYFFEFLKENNVSNAIYIYPNTTSIINRKFTESESDYEIPDLSYLKVYGYKNSEAETFAKDWGCTFVSLGTCHTVSFDTGDASFLVAEGEKYGNYASLPQPTKLGYLFDGWYTDKVAGSKITSDTIVTTKQDQTLYAHWSIEKEENKEVVEEKPTQAEKGTKITDKSSSGKYTVTSKTNQSPTVEYTGTSNKKKKAITIPSTITFKGVKYKVTSVKAKSFKGNKKITTVKIASNITKIGTSAFEGCTNLKTVTIGTGLKTIGKSAFKNCKKLKTLTIKSSKLKSVGKNAFKGIYKKCKIKVPSKKVKAYKKLMKNKGQKSTVKITK